MVWLILLLVLLLAVREERNSRPATHPKASPPRGDQPKAEEANHEIQEGQEK